LEAVRARPENKKFFKHRQPQSPAMSKVRKLTPRTPEQEEARKAIMSRPENKKWFPNGYKPLKVDHPQSPAMPRVRKLTPYTPEQAAAAKAIASRPENKKWFPNGYKPLKVDHQQQSPSKPTEFEKELQMQVQEASTVPENAVPPQPKLNPPQPPSGPRMKVLP